MPDAPLFPESASTLSTEVDALYLFLVAVSTFFTVLIFFLVIFFAIRFRQGSKAPRGKPVTDDMRLEIAWSAIPLVLAMVMFVWGAKIFVDQATPPDDAIEITVVGKQWMWKIQHPTGHREINDLHVPVGQPVKLRMVSEDVIHSFYIPAFRMKADVLPGRYVQAWFEATRPGEYHLFCAEYCGTNHSKMIGTVYVMEPGAYGEWLSGRTGVETPEQAGARLFGQYRCNSCHSNVSGARGPSLEGLFGRTRRLSDGRTIVADEAYIRESILDPAAAVVEGFEPLMPNNYRDQLGEEGVLQIIAYLKSLTDEGGPR